MPVGQEYNSGQSSMGKGNFEGRRGLGRKAQESYREQLIPDANRLIDTTASKNRLHCEQSNVI